jgi:GTPase-associated system helical domain
MSQENSTTSLPIIDKYLENNLLESFGTDESRYRYLTETVNSLLEKIKDDPSLLIQFSLVAFQPNPLAEEPKIILVYDTLKEHWRVVHNVYRERPILLIKAIMLETISRLCDIDGRLASIVYHANASAFTHYKDPKDGLLVHQVLETAAFKAEKFAIDRYIPSIDIEKSPDTKVEIVASEAVEVDRSTLQAKLMAAAGQTDEQGVALTIKPVNQYSVNQGGVWGGMFGNLAGESIAQSIESTIDEALSEFAKEASTVISEKLQEISVYTNDSGESKLQTESKVLWWMQSLYSPKLRASYRDLPLPVTIIAMAHDLFDLVSVPIPESVVYILGEAIFNAITEIPDKERKPIKLKEWMVKLQQTEILTAIEPLQIQSSNLENCTQPLITVFRAVLNGQNPSKEMLGDLLDVAVTPRKLGMWLFRDLVAENLAEE